MNTNTKEKAIERLDAIEAEAKELRSLINQPEQRKPEAGDVWEGGSGSTWIISKDNTEFGTCLTSESPGFPVGSEHDISDMGTLGGTYLGKFDEVYCKISDVREALSHEDDDGQSLIYLLKNSVQMRYFAKDKALPALQKLGIIK